MSAATEEGYIDVDMLLQVLDGLKGDTPVVFQWSDENNVATQYVISGVTLELIAEPGNGPMVKLTGRQGPMRTRPNGDTIYPEVPHGWTDERRDK